MKYLEPSMPGVGKGPQRSVWTKFRGAVTRDEEREKCSLWLFANWQDEQIKVLLYLNSLLHLSSTCLTMSEWVCPNLGCQIATRKQ